jgi:TrmH family RNA methyltransferase
MNISPLTKADEQRLLDLHKKKGRDEYGLFFVEGFNALDEVASSPYVVAQVILSTSLIENEPRRCEDIYKRYKNAVYHYPSRKFAKIADSKTPQGVIIILEKQNFIVSGEEQRFIFLDQIQDPANVAAIIRNAVWFGFDGILLSPNCADIYQPKVTRSSVGALLRMAIWQNVDPALQKQRLPRLEWLGFDAHAGIDLHKTNPPASGMVLCFGNESRGFSDQTEAVLDRKIKIQSISGYFESLNVAVASGIAMYALEHKEYVHE